MARPFSNDLRERVVDAVTGEGLSCRAAAKRFGHRHQHRDRLGAAVSRDGQRRTRPDGWAQAPQAFRSAPGLAALPLPRARLHAARTCRRVERARPEGGFIGAVWTFVHEEGLSYKKRRWSPANGSGPTSPATGHDG
ncbi:TRm2011-2a transposase (plasmid) [Sinorhizobium meliloti 1021]|uniref:TRm2011-2a transposase n=1 Tax=Rhizobium meliloti (strain 1021) TaxID=266834 RepID=Q92XX1_RHIME|nr:TRm2011-2a transposase [Sinorhizobium meliloti 1021]